MSSAKKTRELNRAKTEHDNAKLSAQFAASNHTMLNIAESILAKENSALREQVAEEQECRRELDKAVNGYVELTRQFKETIAHQAETIRVLHHEYDFKCQQVAQMSANIEALRSTVLKQGLLLHPDKTKNELKDEVNRMFPDSAYAPQDRDLQNLIHPKPI